MATTSERLATLEARLTALKQKFDRHDLTRTGVHGIGSKQWLIRNTDPALSDSRLPRGPAGGGLSGSYPDPRVDPPDLSAVTSRLAALETAESGRPWEPDLTALATEVGLLREAVESFEEGSGSTLEQVRLIVQNRLRVIRQNSDGSWPDRPGDDTPTIWVGHAPPTGSLDGDFIFTHAPGA